MLRRAVLVTGFSLLALAGVTFAGCGDSATDGTVDPLADVVFEGGATDEALEAMLAATVKDDPLQQAVFTWPANGDILEPDPAPVFCWQVGGSAGLEPRRARLGVLEPSAAPPPSQPWERAARAVLEPLLSGVRPAYAHGDPINGPAYLLVFSTDADPQLLRVFTTLVEYTPDAASWDKLKSAAAPITATVTWAQFETNRVATDGGPYAGVPITFTVRAAQ